MTYHDEKQLRELFDHFDFFKKGEVELKDFDQALDYVRECPQFSRLHHALDKLSASFASMDTDGGGTIEL